ncbi:MAG: hypothetical protein M3024_03305 [Candidatus Dormibacteraeota bacterium]|nr:hypothetical protein [Candidatus Dormibacteraeota bacterium]
MLLASIVFPLLGVVAAVVVSRTPPLFAVSRTDPPVVAAQPREEELPSTQRRRLIGLVLGLLADQTRHQQRPHLTARIAQLGDGDPLAGRVRLSSAALALLGREPRPDLQEKGLWDSLHEALSESLPTVNTAYQSRNEFELALRALAVNPRLSLDELGAGREGSLPDVQALEQLVAGLATALLLDMWWTAPNSTPATRAGVEYASSGRPAPALVLPPRRDAAPGGAGGRSPIRPRTAADLVALVQAGIITKAEAKRFLPVSRSASRRSGWEETR